MTSNADWPTITPVLQPADDPLSTPSRTIEPPSSTSISATSYPFAEVDVTNLPTAVYIDYSPDRIRQNIFDRLHWVVFGPQSDITVRDGDVLVPFANHTIDKHGMDETDEEEYRYPPPKRLIIDKRNGAPILLEEFIDQVHPFLNANKNQIYKCEYEYFSLTNDLIDGTNSGRVDPAESDGAVGDEEENHFTEPDYFLRRGHIPTGTRFFFDDVFFNEVDTEDFQAYVSLYVEGNMGTSYDEFWRYRARA